MSDEYDSSNVLTNLAVRVGQLEGTLKTFMETWARQDQLAHVLLTFSFFVIQWIDMLITEEYKKLNAELLEQRKELLQALELPEADQWPHIKTVPELLNRAAEVLKLKAEENQANSTLVNPLLNAANTILKAKGKQ